ncbi:hypothetical protein ACWD1Y_08390 [Streptomyces sp. NPDC002814]
MSISNLAQREDQQQLEWISRSVFRVLLDAEAPPFHLLLSGSALVWAGEEEHESREGGPRPSPVTAPQSGRGEEAENTMPT